MQGQLLELVDAASLLFRFDMENVPVGNRWPRIANEWMKYKDSHFTAFADTHIAFGLLFAEGNAGGDVVEEWLGEVGSRAVAEEEIESTRFPTWTSRGTAAVGRALCRAIVHFRKREYAEAVQLLYPLRTRIPDVGGSHAQRDAFQQLLVQCALRSDEPHHALIARGLLNERHAARPRSQLTARLMEKLERALAEHAISSSRSDFLPVDY